MTDEEVARAWAVWTMSEIRKQLDEVGVVDIDDAGFERVVVDVLTDIAVSNTTRAPPHKGTPP